MLTCFGGPADGRRFSAVRAPMYLRVVRTPAGELFALDRYQDVAAPDELVDVYSRRVLQGFAAITGIHGRQTVAVAEYDHLRPQPEPIHLYDTASWRAWCVARHKADLQGDPPHEPPGVD